MKPPRQNLDGRHASYKNNWWLFADRKTDLYRLARAKSRVLANSLVSQHLIFAWLPSDIVYSHKLCVFPDDRAAFFAVMQSRLHET
ncbi:MAG: hypothetical protein SFY95_07415, partial [Planctomycetota bacterium]|nr:hypothetical protein [Planctomycetota bacterium]